MSERARPSTDVRKTSCHGQTKRGFATGRQSVLLSRDLNRRSSLRIGQKRSFDDYWLSHNFSGRLLEVMVPTRRRRIRASTVDRSTQNVNGLERCQMKGKEGGSRAMVKRGSSVGGPIGGLTRRKRGDRSEEDENFLSKISSLRSKKTMVLNLERVIVSKKYDRVSNGVEGCTSEATKCADDADEIKEMEASAETDLVKDVSDRDRCNTETFSTTCGLCGSKFSSRATPTNLLLSSNTIASEALDRSRPVELLGKQSNRRGRAGFTKPRSSQSSDAVHCCPDCMQNHCSQISSKGEIARKGDKTCTNSSYSKAIRDQLKKIVKRVPAEENVVRMSDSAVNPSSRAVPLNVLTDESPTHNEISSVTNKLKSSNSLKRNIGKRKGDSFAITSMSVHVPPRKASLAAAARSSIMTWLQNAPHSVIFGQERRKPPSHKRDQAGKHSTHQLANGQGRRKAIDVVKKKGKRIYGQRQTNGGQQQSQRGDVMSGSAEFENTKARATHLRSAHTRTRKTRKNTGDEVTSSTYTQEDSVQVTVVKVIDEVSDDDISLSDDRDRVEIRTENQKEDCEPTPVSVVTVPMMQGTDVDESVFLPTSCADNADLLSAKPHLRLESENDTQQTSLGELIDEKNEDITDNAGSVDSVATGKRKLRQFRKPPDRFNSSKYIRWDQNPNDDAKDLKKVGSLVENGDDVPGLSLVEASTAYSSPVSEGLLAKEDGNELREGNCITTFSSTVNQHGSFVHGIDIKESSLLEDVGILPLGSETQVNSKAPLISDWTPYGNPIKILQRNGTRRCYYESAVKNDEMLQIDNYIQLHSQKKGCRIGKLKEIFQDDDDEACLVMLCCYHANELPGQVDLNRLALGQMEVLKSRYRFQISLKSVKTKCHVLPYPRYCRFRADHKWKDIVRHWQLPDQKLRKEIVRRPSIVPMQASVEKNELLFDEHVLFCRYFYHYRSGTIKPFRFSVHSTSLS